MSYTASEQALYDHARQSLPRFLFQKENAAEELWGAYVKVFDAARTQTVEWLAQAYIQTATGVWLDQHARDRGTNRQTSETDTDLRARLKISEDAVTVPSLTLGVQKIDTAAGVPSPAVAFVELRRDKAFMGTDSASGTGTSLSFAFGDVLLDAVLDFRTIPWSPVGRTITIAGATSPGNNGTFTITAAPPGYLQWTNASGVSEAFPGTWTVQARAQAYLDRGYRMGGANRPMIFIAILPYGITAATGASVREYLRLRKAAGYSHQVEIRAVP